jgi:hypothetical protein
MSRRNNFFRVQATGCVDADVLAFLSATGITDTTIADALCILVTTAKSQGWYTKVDAIYPFVGGTATTHKFNLKNPADTNAAFRLTFSGGGTHASTGWKPNGTNGYARTYWNPTTQTNVNNASFGLYSRTNLTGANYIYGCIANIGTYRMWHNFNGNIQIMQTSVIAYTANPSTRLFISRREGSTLNESYRDGTSLGTQTAVQSALVNFEFYFGAVNANGSPLLYTAHEVAFAFLGGSAALTATDVANMTAAVNTFQTSLGRNV